MDLQSETEMYDVLVVGAGISGLHAAQCLVREGLNVRVLEGRSRVGGRAWTLRDPSIGFVDLGGAYYGEQQVKVIQLAKSLGLDFYEVPQEGKSVFYVNGLRKVFTGDIPPLSFISLLDLANCLQVLDKLSQQVPLEAPWMADKAEEWDRVTLENFLRKTCWTRDAFTVSSLALFAVTLEIRNSLLDALFLIHSCGGIRALLATQAPYGMQSMKIKQGSNSISEKMAKVLKGKIIFDTRVMRIEQEKNSGVKIYTDNDKVYQAKEVIVALCPLLLRNISFEPSLPENFRAFCDVDMKSRAIKTIMYYDRAYWTECGLKGEFIALDGMVYYGISDAKHDGQHPAIIGFVNSEKHGHMSANERRDSIAKFYADVFQIAEMAEPLNYKEKVWGDEDGEKFSGICVYTVPPGVLTKHKMLWGEAFGRIKFAGVESSPLFRGYMEGGVRAAERSCSEVLVALKVKPKTKLDTKVTEIPYKEFSRAERLLPNIPQLIAICSVGVVLLAGQVYRLM